MAPSQAESGSKRARPRAQGKRPHGIKKPMRRSGRLQEAQLKSEVEHPLPSPPTTNPIHTKTAVHRSPSPEKLEAEAPQDPKRKRKRSPQVDDAPQDPPQKRQRAEQPKTPPKTLQEASTYNPVAHWARTSFWPKDLWRRGFGMDNETPSKKRKTNTTHHSSIIRNLAEYGISMDNSDLVDKDSKELCKRLLKGKRTNIKTSIFSVEQFAEVLKRVRDLNEPRVARDVTPWIVPSAEILYYLDELKLDYIGDGLSVEWSRCAPMGSSKPKPDYVAALLRQAYTQEEIDKIENQITPERLFWFTPELTFPFLICEAKQSAVGLNKADRQNIHSASIAVRAIIELYKEVFGRTAPHRVQELYGKILVFSISHNHDQVSLYGHFAVAGPGSVRYCRYLIDLFSLTTREGENQYVAYNFVLKIYKEFAPVHLKRIKDAVAHLPVPAQRRKYSFITAEVSEGEPDAEMTSQDEGQMMPPPSIPNTAERELLEAEHKRLEAERKMLEAERKKLQAEREADREKSRWLEAQMARMSQEKELMNAEFNSFMKSYVPTNSGNDSGVAAVLRQQITELKEQMERQQQEISKLTQIDQALAAQSHQK